MMIKNLNGKRAKFRVTSNGKTLITLGNFTIKEAKKKAIEMEKANPGANLIYFEDGGKQTLIDFQT